MRKVVTRTRTSAPGWEESSLMLILVHRELKFTGLKRLTFCQRTHINLIARPTFHKEFES
jgi:hypothetical protein